MRAARTGTCSLQSTPLKSDEGLCSTAPRLLAAQAAEFVDALSADIYATGLGTPGPGGFGFGYWVWQFNSCG
jgi:hypothetical protein